MKELNVIPSEVNTFKKKALEAFFNKLKLSHGDILAEARDEANEASYNDISFYYGNGELSCNNDSISLSFDCNEWSGNPSLLLVDWEIDE